MPLKWNIANIQYMTTLSRGCNIKFFFSGTSKSWQRDSKFNEFLRAHSCVVRQRDGVLCKVVEGNDELRDETFLWTRVIVRVFFIVIIFLGRYWLTCYSPSSPILNLIWGTAYEFILANMDVLSFLVSWLYCIYIQNVHLDFCKIQMVPLVKGNYYFT